MHKSGSAENIMQPFVASRPGLEHLVTPAAQPRCATAAQLCLGRPRQPATGQPSHHSARTNHFMCHAASAPVEAVPTANPHPQHREEEFTWKGRDEFSELGDREDHPPLELPHIRSPKRIVLVRHGQSTWNAEGRIQGSSNFSYLTPKGQAQAETTRSLLEKENFDMLIHSPLERAKETAEIVWGSRTGDVHVLPSLREIDLYSFQGLIKQQGKERYGEQYKQWQKRAWEFEIDGQAPVRELWYRASLAWQQVLNADPGMRCGLLVAHNAVNQALIATATGLPPRYFRRLLQSNGATTVLDFQPQPNARPTVTVDRLNQSPGQPFTPEESSAGIAARIVLVRHGATPSTEDGLLLGRADERMTPLGEVQATKTAELLMDMKINVLYTSPLSRAVHTAKAISKLQSLSNYGAAPYVQQLEELTNRDLGDWQGQPAAQVRGDLSDRGAEPVEAFWARAGSAWEKVISAVRAEGGQTVAVVGHSAVTSAMLNMCLDLGRDKLSMWRTDCGGITIIEFPHGAVELHSGNVRCINYTAHLGRWAIPITRETMDDVCGIEGCF